jgi:8-oxo-dGTP pyrophosphatase MutT (NUDIX family)
MGPERGLTEPITQESVYVLALDVAQSLSCLGDSGYNVRTLNLGGDMEIEQLGPPDADHSTGLILHWRERLLFALEPVHHWHEEGGAPLARFVGVGGHLEPGETWEEAVCREAVEEADLQISLSSPPRTYLLREDGVVRDVTAALTWPDPPRPLYIWSARYRLGRPPDVHMRHFVNAVFEATVPGETQPRPAAEMPAILALSEAQLRRAAAQPISLEELLAGGAAIWEASTIPRSIRLYPGGSAQWYVALLEHLASTAARLGSLD